MFFFKRLIIFTALHIIDVLSKPLHIDNEKVNFISCFSPTSSQKTCLESKVINQLIRFHLNYEQEDNTVHNQEALKNTFGEQNTKKKKRIGLITKSKLNMLSVGLSRKTRPCGGTIVKHAAPAVFCRMFYLLLWDTYIGA